MTKSKKSATHKQYGTYIAAWMDHCHIHSINPTSPTVPQALTFLDTIRVSRNLGYNALNTARSALSALLPPVGGIPFGKNPHVKLYMRGAFHERPPCPRYSDTWDPKTVLNLLKTWAPPQTLDLKTLTFKVLMLMLLVSGQRISTMFLIDLDHVHVHDSHFVVNLVEELKQSRPGYRNPRLQFRAFVHDVELCVVRYFKAYLVRTQAIRGSVKKLFLTIKPPHTGASKDSLTRWVRSTMNSAGIDTTVYRPHSVRSASTSAAKRGGASVTEIMNSAGWSRDSTFTRYYDRPVVDNMYDVAVLHV